ncbi:MAG: hypothetical protein EOP52_12230 [Sphingobacteriales bacterium]|nr:MAG: hypothetical protein EOP52_12230 [Sphingobacteriales bacterium]
MDAWTQLTDVALIGTEKAGAAERLQAIALPDGFPEGLQPNTEDLESRFLQTAASLYLYRRCGNVPATAQPADTTAPAETKPYCSTAADAILGDTLQSNSLGLLQLWLQQCRESNCIVFPERLVPLLQLTAQQPALRSAVSAVSGNRGAWLCSLNPDWRFESGESWEDHWSTGKTPERAAALLELRTTDPARAITELEAVWKQEKADVKETLLATLEPHLTAQDGPFLESIATDRSKKVQALATNLLLQLPESSLVQTAQEQMRQLVTLKTEKKFLGLKTQHTLDLRLPETVFAGLEAIQDEKETPDARFQRLLTYTPPAFWESWLGLSPDSIIPLFEAVSPKGNAYKNALLSAAIRFKEATWARLLVNDTRQFHESLLPLLPADERQNYLLRMAISQPESLLRYYTNQQQEWPEALNIPLLRYAASHPYHYPAAFFNSHAHLLPLTALKYPQKLQPETQPNDTSYMSDYMRESWEKRLAEITSLIRLKENILHAFPASQNAFLPS